MTDGSTGGLSSRIPQETSVGIIGGGPAGLLLSRLLHRSGIPSVVLESRDRSYAEQRQRAGMLEQTTVDVLRDCGAGAGSRGSSRSSRSRPPFMLCVLPRSSSC